MMSQSFGEKKRWPKMIPQFFTEKPALKASVCDAAPNGEDSDGPVYQREDQQTSRGGFGRFSKKHRTI